MASRTANPRITVTVVPVTLTGDPSGRVLAAHVSPVASRQQSSQPSLTPNPAAGQVIDDEEDEMFEAFEFAAGKVDGDVLLEMQECKDHDYNRVARDEEEEEEGDRSSQGSGLGSQGTGGRSSSASSESREKRRRRQEEVNRAVQQCRLKRKAMLSKMRADLDQLRVTNTRFRLRSKVLSPEKEWPVFVPKAYPPELASRRHSSRGTRFRAETEEVRRERVRMQNNQAQYRKALRNKYDEENMRQEIEFLQEINRTMRDFVHKHLKSKRSRDADL